MDLGTSLCYFDIEPKVQHMLHLSKRFIAPVLFFASATAFGSGISISNVIFSGTPSDTALHTYVYLTLTWQNAWRNKKNHDAAWVFFKLKHQQDYRSQRHFPVKLTGHSLLYNYKKNGIEPSFFVPPHQGGVMVYPSSDVRGDISWRTRVELDAKLLKGIDFNHTLFGNAYAIEMVYIPTGRFYLGDSDEQLKTNASAFHDQTSGGRLLIQSEDGIEVNSVGSRLAYRNNNVAGYRGDGLGPVPKEFPKGFAGFYVMKYEMTMGQYTELLNALSNQPSAFRSNFGAKDYVTGRGTISLQNGVYQCATPERPANYISWDDGCAFADWAALRPITELEFEKAARGPVNGVAGDFAWRTASFGTVSRYFNSDGDLVLADDLKEGDLSDSQLELYGASYYWVMDLCGSLWERVVTIGSVKGRAFKGSHGDGVLDQFGNATNEDWPNEHQGGFGYRGGGTYDYGMAFGPTHAPISARNFGSWGDGPRSVAYGFRAGVTVP